MTEISSAPPYPRCSDDFTRGKSVCRWPNSALNMTLVASKTGSPEVTAMTISAQFSPSGSHHFHHLLPTHHSKHIISGAASINRFYRQCSDSHCCVRTGTTST